MRDREEARWNFRNDAIASGGGEDPLARNRDALAFAEGQRETTRKGRRGGEGLRKPRSLARIYTVGSDRVAGAASRIANRRITNIRMIRE